MLAIPSLSQICAVPHPHMCSHQPASREEAGAADLQTHGDHIIFPKVCSSHWRWTAVLTLKDTLWWDPENYCPRTVSPNFPVQRRLYIHRAHHMGSSPLISVETSHCAGANWEQDKLAIPAPVSPVGLPGGSLSPNSKHQSHGALEINGPLGLRTTTFTDCQPKHSCPEDWPLGSTL